jgi:hypothetical protein
MSSLRILARTVNLCHQRSAAGPAPNEAPRGQLDPQLLIELELALRGWMDLP